MAVDACSDISSPRISFSHDLQELDSIPVESHQPDALLSNPAIDFDFCIGSQEISSAEELFADGKILPVQIKKTAPPRHDIPRSDPSFKPHKNDEHITKKRLIEYLATSSDAEVEEEKPPTRPFWQFGRSISVNCDNRRPKGLLRSLQFLTRSNSTGSVPNPKPSAFAKVTQKQHSMKETSSISRPTSSASSFQYCPSNNNASKKSSLGKSRSRSSGNGVRISPVLNFPHTYTVSLFGIGSFFCSKKSKKRK